MILIDTGPSPRGWHRLEAFLRCPQLFAWGSGQGGSNPGRAQRFPSTAARVRGSIGHVGLAHVYARQRAIQRGEDPGAYYRPTEAMRLVAGSFGSLGEGMLPIAASAVHDYCHHYATEKWEILGIEDLYETEFYGHRYTARVDLVYRDRAGKIWLLDHKFINKIESKVQSRYVLSGQILGLWHLGGRRHGKDFGGVQLNLVGCEVRSFLRFTPDPAPYAVMNFPNTVRVAEEGISALERKIAANEPIPMAPSEFTCMTSYGKCPAFELCRWGSSTKNDAREVEGIDIYDRG